MSVTRPVTQRVTQPVTLPVTIGAPTSALPIPLTTPVITGTTFVGDMLTVTPGTYLNATTVTGEWYVDGVATGVTNLTYVVDVDDAGLLIEWREEVSNSYGSTQQTASVTAETLLANVQHLYANGEQGALYYFTEDFAGLYQAAAGTTPVTAVGQPVGLMLDRRFGLVRGPELWSGPFIFRNASESGGVFTFESAPSASYIRKAGFDVGKAYALSFRVTSMSEGAIRAYIGSTNIVVTFTGPGTYEAVSVMRGADQVHFLSIGTDNTATIDNISLREVPGNHASQTTTTARPTLRSGPLRIDYDGVDDYLRTVFPALGSDVTIARSIPGVGAQYLTGQTIAAGNWDDSVDSCATLVIDRALTGPETALVTAFLNQQAGV